MLPAQPKPLLRATSRQNYSSQETVPRVTNQRTHEQFECSTSGRGYKQSFENQPTCYITARHKHRCISHSAAARQASVERVAANSWPLSPSTASREHVVLYEGLMGDDFRHPLDQQNTSLLRSIPGLEMVAKTFMGPVAEQVLLLENIASAIKIGPDQLPSVHRLLLDAAYMLRMEAPELYVRQNPTPNAYTLAIAGHKPFIVVHTALLELLNPRELQAVLAHELGHLKCDHGLWLTVANVLASGTVTVLPVVSGLVEEALMRWLRAAELSCDRAALLVAQDPRVVITALMKLAGGSPSLANELNVDAFLQQARSYEEATNSLLGWYLRNAQTRALSHPLPVMRAREIDKWSASSEYRKLLSKNRSNKVQVAEHPPQPATSAPKPLPQQPATPLAPAPASSLHSTAPAAPSRPQLPASGTARQPPYQQKQHPQQQQQQQQRQQRQVRGSSSSSSSSSSSGSEHQSKHKNGGLLGLQWLWGGS